MKVGLVNTYSTLNLGDSAIYSAFARLTHPAQVVADLPADDPILVPTLAREQPLRACDLYVSVGGDIFNNAREWLVTRSFVDNVARIRRLPADRTMLFGQSIPRSCQGLAFHWLARQLRRLASVTVRDEDSLRRLRDQGVAAELSYDVAFSLEPSAGARSVARALYAEASLDPERAILISVRGFDQMYRHDNRAFQERVATLCRQLAKRGHQPALLLQARARGADSDGEVIAGILARAGHAGVLDPFKAERHGIPAWDVTASLLGMAHGVVAVRYHTAIFRLLHGRMPFHLAYSNKGRDLTRRLGLPGMDLERFDPEQCVAAIEASARRDFSIHPIRNQVRADFHSAMARAARA
jgi:polysaccharide pyruvyl transferase WcaK-like protein